MKTNRSIIVSALFAISVFAIALTGCGLPSSGNVETVITKGDKGDKGDQGDPGVKGDQGEQGVQGLQGDAGANGDLLCGDTLIPQVEWHTACDVPSHPGYDHLGNVVCQPGQVQCRGTLSEGGELSLQKVCWGATAGALSESPRCDEDLNCDGAPDNTKGLGDNAADLETCSNATKICLPNGTVGVTGFVAADKQSQLGDDCVTEDGVTIKVLECTLVSGFAKVTCTKAQ